MKVGIIIGTRPEAIKMAPVILELQNRGIDHVVITTAQHREMLDGQLALFNIVPQYDLDIMQQGQDIFYVTTSVLHGLKPILEKEQPDILFLQGDTTTTFAGSLAASYLQIPVGHIEAGLRTWDKANPFPEELNRQLTSRIADIHFAPTEWARQNLLREGIATENIFVTGNTVIDALSLIVQKTIPFTQERLLSIDFQTTRVLLLTTHRRENFGEPMREIFQACRDIVERNIDVTLVYPVHPNPTVQRLAHEVLDNVERVHVIEPMDYLQFIQLMKRCYLILTDSGGIQEEATSFGKPVLVLRTTTERPEAIEAGTAKLVGTDRETIINTAEALLHNSEMYQRMKSLVNPYGDGKAANRIVDILIQKYSPGRQ